MSDEIAWWKILWRDPCCYCGRYEDRFTMEIDHIQPSSRGGGEEWENLTSACKSCNSRKRNQPLHRFLMVEYRKRRRVTLSRTSSRTCHAHVTGAEVEVEKRKKEQQLCPAAVPSAVHFRGRS